MLVFASSRIARTFLATYETEDVDDDHDALHNRQLVDGEDIEEHGKQEDCDRQQCALPALIDVVRVADADQCEYLERSGVCDL